MLACESKFLCGCRQNDGSRLKALIECLVIELASFVLGTLPFRPNQTDLRLVLDYRRTSRTGHQLFLGG